MLTNKEAAVVLDTDIESVEALADDLDIDDDGWDEAALLEAGELLDDADDDAADDGTADD